ncbi:MAG TPA: diaminobutyrate acetyltransferase [Gammaproteobacteria bacterium]|nr:diaminobutyrate acetyltransferase [Gammaproteobacteria bacterium]
MSSQQSDSIITLRTPRTEDGADVWRLVKASGVLDVNSAYLYLLLCKDFADTCTVAEKDGALVGFVTGYRPPGRPDVLFVWQIGVDAAARGQGLGSRLLDTLLAQDGCRGIRFIETTISPSNKASRRLFHSLAERLDIEIVEGSGFEADIFPESGHEAENLFRLGPLR